APCRPGATGHGHPRPGRPRCPPPPGDTAPPAGRPPPRGDGPAPGARAGTAARPAGRAPSGRPSRAGDAARGGRAAESRGPAARPVDVKDRAAPPPTLLLRQKEVRQRSVEEFGGTKESEAAVERGLDWLATHQNPNGSWGLNSFHANCKHPRCPDAGTVSSD